MAHITADLIQETSASVTGNALTLLGATTGNRAFSAKMANGDTCYAMANNGAGLFQAALYTWTTGGILTTIAANVLDGSSGAGVIVTFTGTVTITLAPLAGNVIQYDDVDAIELASIAVNPAAPPDGFMYFYPKKISGRTVPKWMPPSGVDNPIQSALYGNNIIMYQPNTGTTAGLNLGTPWVVGTTISHPTPASTAPAMFNQLKRTRSANVVTTTNQVLGVSSIATGAAQFWRGNAAGLGGFFFHSRFTIELWPAATVRLFVGLVSGTTNPVASDTLPAVSMCGLWHATTDAATVLNFTTKDGTTSSNTAITLTGALAANQAFDFYMYTKPNDSTIYFRLDDLVAGTTLIDSSKTTNLPANTVFMGPCVSMSNGTANITANTVAIGVNRIYVESDH